MQLGAGNYRTRADKAMRTLPGTHPSTLRGDHRGLRRQGDQGVPGTGDQDPSATKARIIESARERIENGLVTGANLKTVWQIATQPYPEAHFATFPEEIPERCIKLGTSEKGCCAECGVPYERQSVSLGPSKPNPNYRRAVGAPDESPTRHSGLREAQMGSQWPRKDNGWAPGCDHEAGIEACTVLDPFAGSGTTLQVARRLGRRSIGIELNPAYVKLARERCQANVPDLDQWCEPE